MDLGLNGKLVVLVGGATGMGAAAAEVLAGEGARLAIVGRSRAPAEEKLTYLQSRATDKIGFYEADGTVPGSLESTLDKISDELGPLWGLAVTAGPMQRKAPFCDLQDADWEDYFQVQLMLSVRACRTALPLMKANGGGAIVLTSALSIHEQKPNYSAYSAMKSSIASLSKNIALNWGAQGVRCNCIAPGAIATEALEPAKKEALERYGPDIDPMEALSCYMRDEWDMKVALERAGQPQEVGELIAFLLSRRAGYLTGALINIDGGTNF